MIHNKHQTVHGVSISAHDSTQLMHITYTILTLIYYKSHDAESYLCKNYDIVMVSITESYILNHDLTILSGTKVITSDLIG